MLHDRLQIGDLTAAHVGRRFGMFLSVGVLCAPTNSLSSLANLSSVHCPAQHRCIAPDN